MDFGTNGGSALDFATFMNSALRNNEDGMWSGNGGLLWIFLLILFWGNGGMWGNRNGQPTDVAVREAVEKAVAQARADGLSDQVIVDAVKGNAAAIQQLANTLNCDMNSIKTSLCSLDKGLAQVGGQIGMSSQQIINAIQAGNCDLAGKIAECCCSTRQLITQLSYDNRIQNMEQTTQLQGVMTAGFNQIGNKIDGQTIAMNAGFQGIKDYLSQEKINGLQHQVTQLENAANNAAQTNAIGAYVSAALAPIQNQVAQLVNAVPPRAVPAYPAPEFYFGNGYNGFYGYGYNNCGCGCGFNHNCGCGC